MPEFPPHEIRDGFLFAGRFRAAKRLGNNFPARPHAQQGTGEHRLRRHRDFLQLAVPQDVSRGLWIGLQSSFSMPSSPDQIEDRFRALKTLRSGFEEKAVFFDGADQAADSVGGFEKRDGDAKLLQTEGASQAGNSSADHDDWFGVGHVFGLLAKEFSRTAGAGPFVVREDSGRKPWRRCE